MFTENESCVFYRGDGKLWAIFGSLILIFPVPDIVAYRPPLPQAILERINGRKSPFTVYENFGDDKGDYWEEFQARAVRISVRFW
jgi:hypothetical protein